MNALVRSAITRVPRAVPQHSRAASAFAKKPMPTQGSYADVCYGTWTSDPGAYPIIVVITCAGIGSASYIAYKLMYDRDIQYDPSKRSSVLRTWG